MHLRAGTGILLLLLIQGLLLQGCARLGAGLQEPTIRIDSLRLLESQGLSQRFALGLILTNPNDQALPVEGMTYALSLNGVDLLSGATNQIPTLEAYADTPLTLEVSADLFAALRLLNALAGESQDSLDYDLRAKIDLQGWRPSFNVSRDGSIQLRQ